MKKMVLVSVLLTGFLQAVNLDLSSAKLTWTAFKTKAKTPVNGSFESITYKLGKSQDSLKTLLEGASASMDSLKVNLGDDTKNKNVKEAFFALFKNTNIKVTFRNVIEGDHEGSLTAYVRMNEKLVKVPMQYTIAGDKLVVKGVLDLLNFGLKNELASLAKRCESFHEGLTWSQVEIQFESMIKG
ncbi:YceI family protein [Helicobacter pylori]|uniref:YceI family protein n=1 Tax=Helicobacter pylori TaxID=210 RepID=UPI000EAFA1EB|nr:YceI family protein [Helicobacter pylori]